jgi:hypothetical protein
VDMRMTGGTSAKVLDRAVSLLPQHPVWRAILRFVCRSSPRVDGAVRGKRSDILCGGTAA